MSLDKLVSEVMSERVTTLESTVNLLQAIQTMARANIGALVVVDQGDPVGIFSERDLLKRVIAKGISPRDTTLGAVMTPKLICVPPSTPIKEVVQKMYTMAIRHMLVMEGGQLKGIFSQRDMMRHLLV